MASEATSGSLSPDFYLEDKPGSGASDKEHEDYEKLLVGLAKLAEKAERYDDMCKYLTEVVNSKTTRGKPLLEDERNLLSVAFKNVVGGLRSSWRTLNSDKDGSNTLLPRYSDIVEQELEDKCKEVISLLENKLTKNLTEDKDSLVFFKKMCGDYFRYLAEFRDTSEEYKEKARDNYQEAYDLAKEHLPETHPTRLGLALNFSVCHYEILKNHAEACRLAKTAFDEAIQKLDTLNDSNYKDSTLIMQLLRDNLTLWTSDANEDNED